MELRFSSRSSPEVYFYDPISENMPFKSHLNGSIRKTSAFLAPSTLPNLSFGDGIFAERTILGSHTKSKLILHTFKGILLANSLIAIYRGQLPTQHTRIVQVFTCHITHGARRFLQEFH